MTESILVFMSIKDILSKGSNSNISAFYYSPIYSSSSRSSKNKSRSFSSFQKMYGFGGLGEVEVEIWSDVTIAGRTTNEQKRKDRATQPMDHGRLR